MDVLDAVAGLLTQEVDLDVVLGRMVDAVARQLDAERATLFLLDPATGDLVSKAAHLPELPFIRLPPGTGVASLVARTGAVVNLPRPDSDPRWYEGVDRETGFKTRNLLALPVRLPGQESSVVGVLQALNKRGGAFTRDDEVFAQALSGQVATALDCTSLGARLRRRKAAPPELRYRYNRIIGDSDAMAAVYERVHRAALTDATVLVTGESGTGKELIARAVHCNGRRSARPFVKVDCAALPPTLVENELFGHARGAYTGADRHHAGKFEQADGGTLFLDEVGELPLPVQGKLLRFLQDRELEPIGSGRAVTVDVRVVSATNRDLPALVQAGQFRQDLYYRLRVVEVVLPPLRERGLADVERLVDHFLEVYGRKHGVRVRGMAEEAWQRLRAHRWPGNVRELENCIEAAVVLAADGWIPAEVLGLPGGPVARPAGGGEPTVLCPLAEVERAHILRVLEHVGGNRSRAAAILGIGRNTLARKLRDMDP